MAEEKKEVKAWKCRHCLFMKKDKEHGGVRVCFLGGTSTMVDAGKDACEDFHPSRRALAVGKYLKRVDEGIVGGDRIKKQWKPDPNVTAKEMLARLQKHLVNKPESASPLMRTRMVAVAAKPIPVEERTNAYGEQMCAGRCCKRKEVCKHYRSWIEHGRPKDAIKMVRSMTGCVNDTDSGGGLLRFSHFVPLDGMTEDDVKEYADIGY